MIYADNGERKEDYRYIQIKLTWMHIKIGLISFMTSERF